MAITNEVDPKNIVNHKSDVVQAVKMYHKGSNIKMFRIASNFNKTENEITDWFCEAISKRYIKNDAICQSIISKHIKEYELRHNITNSSLRQKYSEAIKIRKTASNYI